MGIPVGEHYVGEDLIWRIDADRRLPTGSTVASCGTPVLTRLDDGTVYAAGLNGGPSPAGRSITQRIHGLVSDVRYRLRIPFTDSDGNQQVAVADLWCPY